MGRERVHSADVSNKISRMYYVQRFITGITNHCLKLLLLCVYISYIYESFATSIPITDKIWNDELTFCACVCVYGTNFADKERCSVSIVRSRTKTHGVYYFLSYLFIFFVMYNTVNTNQEMCANSQTRYKQEFNPEHCNHT
jgi:hypothetical protein